MIFLKLNTGMNRLGFPPEQFSAAMEALRAILPWARLRS